MNKEATLLCLLLTAAVLAVSGGCARRPAYSEMDANRTPGNQNQNQNQNSEGQATASASTPASPSPTEAAQPAPPPQFQAIKSPSFMDKANGDIKDLPAYPHAYRVSAQVGPMQGVNTMSLALKSTDTMDKITAFYERVIKDNKWTVIDRIIDPEFSEWNLKKGEDHSGKVQVKKSQQSGAMNIVIVRGEKMEGASK